MLLSKGFRRKFCVLVTIISVGLSFSCGMVGDEGIDNSVYDLENLEPACPLKAEEFANILDKDLSKEIDCVEANLSRFTKFVKLSNKEEIKKSELQIFVNKFLSKKPEEVNIYLNILFKINSLALKDSENTMRVKSIPLFVNIARQINIHGRKVKTLLDEIDGGNYLRNRELLINSFNEFSSNLLKIIKVESPNGFSIDVLEFATEIDEVADEGTINLSTIKELLFLKRVIVGGEASHISAFDFEKIVALSSDLARLYLDIVETHKKDFEKESSFYKFLLSAIIDFNKIIMKNSKEEVYFSSTDTVSILNHFVGGRDWENISQSLEVFKLDIVGGQSNYYDKKDIQKLFTFATEAFESLFFFGHTFEQLEHELLKNKVIQELDFPASSDYDIINQSRLIPLWHDFVDVARTYRTFPQANNLTLFSYQYKRSRWGFLLQSILRYGGEKLFDVYHTNISKDGEMSVDADQIRRIVLDYQDALKEFQLWPENLDRLVNELLMGSDLFQYSSNGDLLLQSVEIAQYLPTVIGANIIGKEVHENLEVYCNPDPTLSYEMECYRNNFFPSLFFDLDKVEYFPNFFNYFSSSSWQATQKYLEDAEKMARINPDPILPMTKVDLSRLVTSMSNTEGLFLKYDENKNGILERIELDKVFEVLKLTLAKEANLKPESKLLKSVYYYIVKKQKEPTTAGLLWFHVFGKKKNIKANRNTIAGVLKMFGFKNKMEKL